MKYIIVFLMAVCLSGCKFEDTKPQIEKDETGKNEKQENTDQDVQSDDELTEVLKNLETSSGEDLPAVMDNAFELFEKQNDVDDQTKIIVALKKVKHEYLSTILEKMVTVYENRVLLTEVIDQKLRAIDGLFIIDTEKAWKGLRSLFNNDAMPILVHIRSAKYLLLSKDVQDKKESLEFLKKTFEESEKEAVYRDVLEAFLFINDEDLFQFYLDKILENKSVPYEKRAMAVLILEFEAAKKKTLSTRNLTKTITILIGMINQTSDGLNSVDQTRLLYLRDRTTRALLQMIKSYKAQMEVTSKDYIRNFIYNHLYDENIKEAPSIKETMTLILSELN